MLKPSRLCKALALAFGAAALAHLSPAQAQQQSLERVTITGSSIKRLESETALPVTVITREQIEKTGATSVEDILRRVSASSAMLSDTTQGVGYATANANLRGLGANSTLVLLNGRRLANHPFGTIGGNAAVDLNSIPFAAIERIEVLRDGASAVYGTDAVGGVINFITRRDYRNGELMIRYGDTEAGIGGSERGASVAVGFGDLGSQGFNVLLTANFQKNSRIKAIDQGFYNRGVQEIPGSDPPSSSAPYPGFIEGAGAAFPGIAPGAYPELNPGANFAPCVEPFAFSTVRGTTPSGIDARGCRAIYAATLDNLPDSKKGDIFGRATFALSQDHQLFVEGSYARNHTIGRVAPTPIRYGFGPFNAQKFDFEPVLMPITSKYFPTALLTRLGFTAADYDPDGDGLVGIGLRAFPAGNRISTNTNTQKRMVVGASGTFSGWDYDAGINVSRAEGLLNYAGYIHEDRFLAALRSGNLNPFGPSDDAGNALWKLAGMDGDMRKSASTTTAFDLKVSKELMEMAGGRMAVAFGTDLRREKADDKPLNADYAAGKHIGGEGTVPATSASRSIKALFGELSMPFAKGWEATLAARYDNYSDFGSTFNPRASLRFQPTKALLFRAAAGTGFRAPTLWDVNSPVSFSNTADTVNDPECPRPSEVNGRCASQLPTRSVASANLKPEKSRQISAGVVFEPARNLSLGLDYWRIQKKSQIGVIAANTLLEDPVLYQRFNSRVKRNADGFILYVETPVDNLGDLRTSGVDIDVRSSLELGEGGRLNLGVGGTYVNQYDAQKYAGGPYGKFAGSGGDSTVPPVPRWQHTATAEWQFQNFGFTVEHVYTRGWTESAASVNANVFVNAPHRVSNTERVNLAFSYLGFKNLKLRLGVRNAFDDEPPYVASSSFGSHAAGYAASFADPRGRFWYGTASYQFK
ncbi:TonB-dependent receptor [Paucibacter sp. M5-1]|uniref:TonB-dependent receptor n=1 Tax=Paucibacter sp. M5-1 TaxID=3015998 RepID=UPI0022B88B37|nr:TonB-dependent receptor [Paucibacter sp. M5-1]MCZ7882447.1 TonB-dependent receptor [Paucibacter sp. M5-1]